MLANICIRKLVLEMLLSRAVCDTLCHSQRNKTHFGDWAHIFLFISIYKLEMTAGIIVWLILNNCS